MSLLSASDDVSLGARIQLMAQAFQGSNAKLTVKTCVFYLKDFLRRKPRVLGLDRRIRPWRAVESLTTYKLSSTFVTANCATERPCSHIFATHARMSVGPFPRVGIPGSVR